MSLLSSGDGFWPSRLTHDGLMQIFRHGNFGYGARISLILAPVLGVPSVPFLPLACRRNFTARTLLVVLQSIRIVEVYCPL
jgi:hypothetical protein